MAVVYKYPLVVTDRQLVTMPKEAKIPSVQVQNGAPYMWALVNPENGTEEVPIRIHGTGHNIPDADRLAYIGTFQMPRYGLVFHAFLEQSL